MNAQVVCLFCLFIIIFFFGLSVREGVRYYLGHDDVFVQEPQRKSMLNDSLWPCFIPHLKMV